MNHEPQASEEEATRDRQQLWVFVMTIIWPETTQRASVAVFIQDVDNIYYLLPRVTSLAQSQFLSC